MRAVIVGAAPSALGAVAPGTTPADLMAEAGWAALGQCGLTPADVDAVFAASTQLPWASVTLADALRIAPRFSDSTQVGGGSALAHLRHARAAIAAGECEVALIAYGSTQRLVGRAAASVQEVDPYEAPYAPMLPLAAYGLAASRHMFEFGTSPEQLAQVAVDARAWARRTPGAWSTDPLTVEDVLAAPRVCDPLGLRDCCLVTDGGGALVVVSSERARALGLRARAVLLGGGEAIGHRHLSGARSLTTTAAVDSGARAFAAAGLAPSDVSSVQLYDAFTITPILLLEDLGFCAKGDGGPFVAGGATAPGGALPMNTNGGGLSFGHPGMNGMLQLLEAVRRIDDGDDVVCVHGNGGVLSTQTTVILGSEAAA